jgi:predicted acylesterase/phospholipase RssA
MSLSFVIFYINVTHFFSVIFANKKALLSIGVPKLLRTYDMASEPAATCTIVEAAWATSAAPFYFRAQKIDGKCYVDGGLGTNNPCAWIINEAESLCPNRQIGTILSIGTSSKSPRANPLVGIAGISTGMESTHQLLEGRFKGQGIYHRFQVGDLGREVHLNQWEKMRIIRQRTTDYLAQPEVKTSIKKIARTWGPVTTFLWY